MKIHTLIITALGFFLIALQTDLWMGQGGLLQFIQLNKELKEQIAQNTQLETRNSILHAEVLDLKEGLDAIEERARVELGMIKPGETFYQIIGQTDEPR